MSEMPLSEDQVREVAGLLEAFPGFGKRAEHGSPLQTRVEPGESALARAWAAGPGRLSQEDFRRVVWIVDFMAVARPDGHGIPWRPETLELASRLRKLYSARYGRGAYGVEG